MNKRVSICLAHMSGSDIEYSNLVSSNLLLYKPAMWGYEKRMKIFRLGGYGNTHFDQESKFFPLYGS
ncbi:hypothetical protein [uncultured Parabacteroides sp.]|jgi:hypothetical protein|uniref:hypothetical protein n=1 Tax=uncultured Parabacteroides sp. TaxID=512312 RepID=UPI002622D602|nr:hypothetical protein [uncultured Parabacteroides sp.]